MPLNTPRYKKVSTLEGLVKILDIVGETDCALDFETTSLRPQDGRVRLVSLCNKKVKAVVDFDQIKGGFKAVAKLFDKGQWVVFNAGFELRWFIDAGCPNTACLDVGYLRRAILGGGSFRLLDMVAWDLGETMSKEQQLSNWSAKLLSREQLDYAFLDAYKTFQLWQHWHSRAASHHWGGFYMLNEMVPAVIEMEDSGMKLDVKRHRELCLRWEKVQRQKYEEVRDIVSASDVANIQSDSQWSDFLGSFLPDALLLNWPRTEKTGQLKMSTDVLRQVAAHVEASTGENPLSNLLDALADYKKITKYLSSFGETLITKAELSKDKRVRARFNIGAAKTCRFSSSNPNLQQIPRDNELMGEVTSVRKSFTADLGRKLVSLDYSGIELRVLALLAEDDQLLEDVVFGDVHAEVASVVAGKKINPKSKEGKTARSKAKGVSFGIIYGSGAGGLSTTMRTTVENAQRYIDFWADRYKNAFNYRHEIMTEATRTKYIRVIDGGTIYMGKKPELPRCANYPVQRAALAVMARAIVRHKVTLDKERAAGRHRMTRMLSTIHDALIDEASSRNAADCLRLMEKDMVAAYLDYFPNAPTENLVEGGIGKDWGTLE